MNKIVATIIVLATFAVAFYIFALKPWSTSPPTPEYSNSEYGISFKHSAAYAVEEKEVGNGERRHYAITLIDKNWLANPPEAGEGPPAISIDIHQNNLDKLSVENWVRSMSFSNFKLSPDGKISTVSVAGTQASYYHWDGLYQGESYALAHRENIVVFSTTYNAESDQIRKDFAQVLSSLTLY